MLKIKLIFPLDRGVIIQLQKGGDIYQHFYKHVALAAQVLQIAQESSEHLDLQSLPDNQCRDWLIPTAQELSSGYYTVYDSLADLQNRADMSRRSIFLMKNIMMVYAIEMKNKRGRRASNIVIVDNVKR